MKLIIRTIVISLIFSLTLSGIKCDEVKGEHCSDWY